MFTGWSGGAAMPMMAAVFCSFFAGMDAPVPAIYSFLKALLLSLPLGALYVLVLMPLVVDLPTLAVVCAPVFLVLGAYMARPATLLMAMGLLLSGVLGTLSLHDTGQADFASFVNSSIGQVLGGATAAVVTALVRSVSAEWSARRIQRPPPPPAAAHRPARHRRHLAGHPAHPRPAPAGRAASAGQCAPIAHRYRRTLRTGPVAGHAARRHRAGGRPHRPARRRGHARPARGRRAARAALDRIRSRPGHRPRRRGSAGRGAARCALERRLGIPAGAVAGRGTRGPSPGRRRHRCRPLRAAGPPRRPALGSGPAAAARHRRGPRHHPTHGRAGRRDRLRAESHPLAGRRGAARRAPAGPAPARLRRRCRPGPVARADR
ncbi:FUSC family protein [Paracidovorax oryzae]|uniref:FUSC family protein n=1 Tax=Paracidovorax oryzae TaxID=862720 RepID=UPI0025A3E775|nr:FUSC family protein [Paracidovorax oryzae]